MAEPAGVPEQEADAGQRRWPSKRFFVADTASEALEAAKRLSKCPFSH